MTKEEAIRLYESKWWEGRDANEVFWFQLNEDLLCMPFAEFQRVAEAALGRSVWTHEFCDRERLRAEYLKERPAPLFADILAMLPAKKTIVVVGP